MLKKYVICLLGLSSSLLLATSAQAQVKTSSLAMEKPASIKLIPQCQNMFNTASALVRDAERQPGTHTQVKRLKNKLLAMQKQITQLDSELQQKSCEKGLVALNILKQKH